MATSLTPKQQRFVEEYLVDLNATQAAIRTGYSEKTARQQGARLLTNADIATAVVEGREKLSERSELTAAWVLTKQRELYSKATTDATAAGLEVARKAVRDIGEHLGMYVERQEISGPNGEPMKVVLLPALDAA